METLNNNMKNLLEKLNNKQALHAELLGFEHPISKENHIFQTDPPKEMLDIIKLI
jgi:23S rRNA-/tRNA-specific pseudouridylate synthase